MTSFDEATKKFTHSLCKAADWKHGYYGAAYSTRLEQAIKDVREACDEMESIIFLDAINSQVAKAKEQIGAGDFEEIDPSTAD